MRLTGTALLLAGLLLLAGGLFFGCGSFFSWNGRHPIATGDIELGTPVTRTLPVRAGRRYTLAVQVVFEREGLPEENGALVVRAKLPLSASIKSPRSGEGPAISGWLDTELPPTTLYGQAAEIERQRRPAGSPPPELVAERLLGPYTAPDDGEAAFAVDLGRARALGEVGGGPASPPARIRQARLAVYDDQMPSSVRLPFHAAGAGGLCVLAGAVLLGSALFRGGARRRKNV